MGVIFQNGMAVGAVPGYSNFGIPRAWLIATDSFGCQPAWDNGVLTLITPYSCSGTADLIGIFNGGDPNFSFYISGIDSTGTNQTSFLAQAIGQAGTMTFTQGGASITIGFDETTFYANQYSATDGLYYDGSGTAPFYISGTGTFYGFNNGGHGTNSSGGSGEQYFVQPSNTQVLTISINVGVTPTPTPTPTPEPCLSGFTISNCGTSHVYNQNVGVPWTTYGQNYLQVGASQDGGGSIAPQAGWYFVDDCGRVRQLLNTPVWISGGQNSPWPNGSGWLCVVDAPFIIGDNVSTLTFCESMPTVTTGPYYYSVNTYGCGGGNCTYVNNTLFVTSNTPLTMGYFYNNPENRGYTFEIISETTYQNAAYILTGEPGFIICSDACNRPTPTPTATTVAPTPTPTSNGLGSWYFYSDEGNLNAGPPTSNGNAIFTVQGSPVVETFNPNKSSGVSYLAFNLHDSSGTDYTSFFNTYTGGTGTITLTQNGDTATYTSTTPGSFFIDPTGFFIISTAACTQTKTSNATYVYADPITITFGS